MFNFARKTFVFNFYKIASLESLTGTLSRINQLTDPSSPYALSEGKSLKKKKDAIQKDLNFSIRDLDLNGIQYILNNYDKLVKLDKMTVVTMGDIEEMVRSYDRIYEPLSDYFGTFTGDIKSWCIKQAIGLLDKSAPFDSKENAFLLSRLVECGNYYLVNGKTVYGVSGISDLTLDQLYGMVLMEKKSPKYYESNGYRGPSLGDDDYYEEPDDEDEVEYEPNRKLAPVAVMVKDGVPYYLYHGDTKFALEYLGCGMNGDPSASSWCFRGYQLDGSQYVKNGRWTQEYYQKGDVWIIYREDKPFASIDMLSNQYQNDRSINISSDEIKKDFKDFFKIILNSSIDRAYEIEMDVTDMISNDIYDKDVVEDFMVRYNGDYRTMLNYCGGEYFKIIPREVLTKDFVLEILNDIPDYAYIPEEYFSDENFVCKAIEEDFSDIYNYIFFVLKREDWITEKVLFAYLENRKNLGTVYCISDSRLPKRFQTEEIIWKILEDYFVCYNIIPIECYTEEMCRYLLDKGVEIDVSLYAKFPNIFNKEFCLHHNISVLNNHYTSFSEEIKKDPDIIKTYVSFSPSNIQNVPDSYLGDDLILEMVDYCVKRLENFYYFAKKIGNRPELIEKIISKYPFLSRWFITGDNEIEPPKPEPPILGARNV